MCVFIETAPSLPIYNIQYHRVLLVNIHLNGYSVGFHPETSMVPPDLNWSLRRKGSPPPCKKIKH